MKISSITNYNFKGGIIANVPIKESGFFGDKVVKQSIDVRDIVCVNNNGEMVLQIQPEDDNFLVRALNKISEMKPKLTIAEIPKSTFQFEVITKSFKETVERMKRTDGFAIVDFDELYP